MAKIEFHENHAPDGVDVGAAAARHGGTVTRLPTAKWAGGGHRYMVQLPTKEDIDRFIADLGLGVDQVIHRPSSEG